MASVNDILSASEDDETWVAISGYEIVPYSDEDTILIDESVIASGIQEQIINQGEANSQYICFVRDRYQDGIDLSSSEMTVSVAYIKPDGNKSLTKCVNVEVNETKIRYGWIVPAYALDTVGTLRVATFIYGKVTDSDGTNERIYQLTDIYASLTIHESVINSTSQSDPTVITLYVSRAETADSVEWDDILSKPETFTPAEHTHPFSDITGTLDWNNVSNKPETFTPSAHTHPFSDITGTLDWNNVSNKPETFTPAAHTHPFSDITGTLDWNNVSNKPETFTPAAHTHTVSDITDVNKLMSVSDYVSEGGTGKVLSAKTADSVGWSNVSNKPETFTPAAHTHTVSEITDANTLMSVSDYVSEGGTGKVLSAVSSDTASSLTESAQQSLADSIFMLIKNASWGTTEESDS